MPLTREERKLLHQKSKEPTFGSGNPDNNQGLEGDLAFRKISGSGTVQYIKQSHEWIPMSSSGTMPPVRIGSGGGGTSAGTGGMISSHPLLDDLDIDGHTQYLLVDGTRDMDSVLTIGGDADGTDRSITWGHTTLKSIMGIDDSQDKFAINTDAAFEDVNDFEINTNGTLTLGAGLLEIYQLGGNDYQPGIHLWNYDANNDNDQGFSQMVFYNSKSDTVADTATDADAHLGRILFKGNAGGGDGSKYAVGIN